MEPGKEGEKRPQQAGPGGSPQTHRQRTENERPEIQGKGSARSGTANPGTSNPIVDPRIEGTISDIFWGMVLVKATVNGRKYVVKHVNIKGLKINDKVTFEVLPLSDPEGHKYYPKVIFRHELLGCAILSCDPPISAYTQRNATQHTRAQHDVTHKATHKTTMLRYVMLLCVICVMLCM